MCVYVNICMYLVLLCIFGKKLLRACVYWILLYKNRIQIKFSYSYLKHLIWHNPSMPKYPSECTGGVKFLISRIPLIGLETRLGWRTDRKFLRNPNLNEIRTNQNQDNGMVDVCISLAMNIVWAVLLVALRVLVFARKQAL